jgi:hypothetical protein
MHRHATWVAITLAAGCAQAVAPPSPRTMRAPPTASTAATTTAIASVAPSAVTAASLDPDPPDPEPEEDVADPADDANVVAANVYGELTNAQCLTLLDKRGISYVKLPKTSGVELPIRLTGPLHGVDLHGGEPAALRSTSPTEILDCRLALALDDFAGILEDHHVIEAVHWSIYRAPPIGTEEKAADHTAGLAIDLGALFEDDGSRTGVAEDWRGEIGGKTCGNGAYPVPATKRAWRLRAILCTTAASHVFHLVLTPNFNAAHHDHFHLEIKRHSTFSFVK